LIVKVKQVRCIFNAEVQFEDWTVVGESEAELMEAAGDRISDDPEYWETDLYQFYLSSDEDEFIREFYLAGGA
jgi:hypothetical protein